MGSINRLVRYPLLRAEFLSLMAKLARPVPLAGFFLRVTVFNFIIAKPVNACITRRIAVTVPASRRQGAAERFRYGPGGIAMVEDDTAYYRQRAVTELAMAGSASRAEVAGIHEELARQYQALADQYELRPPPSAVDRGNSFSISS